MLRVPVVVFFVLDDSGPERRPVTGAIDSKGTHGPGFHSGVQGGFPGRADNRQPFFLCHNDLLTTKINKERYTIKPFFS